MVQPNTFPLRENRCPEDQLMDEYHPQNETITVRIGFAKTGLLRFISHLDLQKTMKRAFLRADLPVWFSEGYNPHPKMVFATPLSVGMESLCEFADIRLTKPITPRMLKDSFNRVMDGNLTVWHASTPVFKLTDAYWSSYEIVLVHPNASPSLALEMDSLYKGPLPVVKRTKSTEKEVDISPFIRIPSVSYEEVGAIRIRCQLCVSNTDFLNPSYLIAAASSRFGLSFDRADSHWSVLRTDLFLKDGVTPFL
ncbi:MAG: DUF2344 domain-containing protein [Clostridia bacterium]|nr:DUF2344 domain-containing protein [Clostridia bacterium]